MFKETSGTCRDFAKKILHGVYGLVGLGITAEMNFSDAPGGDLNLDDIFGDASSTSTTVKPPEETPTPADATTQTVEPVIKTKTGTIYKSIGDAVSGIEHKDELIAQLREQVRKNTGNDPLLANRPPANTPVNYADNQDQYFTDIAKAVETKDTAAYMRAQQKLIWDTMGPLAPTITSLSRANAERVVSEKIPDFKGFLQSEQYSQMGESYPLLADAIKSAESNPAAAQQLPELYRVAYLTSQGSRVPELIQSVRNDNSPTPPRPTVQSTPLAPPSNNGVPVVQPSMDSPAGRKALIEQMEAKGIGNQKW